MAALVAVVDPLPLFRDGAVAALTADGHMVETPSDVVAWLRKAPDAVVLFTVLDEADWAVLARLSQLTSAASSLVVLVPEVSGSAGVRAVAAGARCVLARHASAEVLRRTVSATIDGQAVLPVAVLAALAAGIGGDAGPAGLPSAQKISWLRALATGATVAQLAGQVGYSERAMFRMLRVLYRDMGAGGRVEALMLARERGWL